MFKDNAVTIIKEFRRAFDFLRVGESWAKICQNVNQQHSQSISRQPPPVPNFSKGKHRRERPSNPNAPSHPKPSHPKVTPTLTVLLIHKLKLFIEYFMFITLL